MGNKIPTPKYNEGEILEAPGPKKYKRDDDQKIDKMKDNMAPTVSVQKEIQEALKKNDESTLGKLLSKYDCPSDIIVWCLGKEITLSNDTLKLLLEHGADVNASYKDVFGSKKTALMHAAGEGDADKLRILIEYGADVNKLQLHGTTLQPPMARSSPVFHDSDYSPLMLAATMNDAEWAKELTDSGEDVNLSTKEGKSALKFAITNSSIECCKVLIENGADISNVDAHLKLALDHGSVGCARIFLDLGANVNGAGEKGTPLILAIKKDDDEWAKDLLKRGADVNAGILSGWPWGTTMQETPLMFAVERQSLKMVNLLIDHGADVNIKTHEHGETILDQIIQASKHSIHDVERRKRLRDIYCVLVSHGAKCVTNEEVPARAVNNDALPPSLQHQIRNTLYKVSKGKTGVSYSTFIDSLTQDGYLPARLKPFMMYDEDANEIRNYLQTFRPYEHFPQSVRL